MSEFTPLREAVDALADRALPPDFGELKRRATHRGRRRVVMVAAATAAVIAGSVLTVTGLDDDRRTAPVDQPKLTPKPAAAPNGWVAVDAHQGGGDIYLVRADEETPAGWRSPGRMQPTMHVRRGRRTEHGCCSAG
ncbi:MAG: hypothetical protein ACRDP2_11085 [Nocardioidaceae bacterium]